jgi:hypothetical protein
MALPASGAISMSQVKAETGLTSNSIRDYASYFSLAAPDSMSEFYSKSGTSYSISPNTTNVNESGSVTYTITTTNLTNGTSLYWKNTGTTIGADFSDGLNSGSVTTTNNTASLVRTLLADNLTEGSETLIIGIWSGSYTGLPAVTATTVTVADTSLTPTYAVAPNVTSVNEGGQVVWTITTTNVPNGTVLYWTNSGTTNASDFTDSTNSGTITIGPSGTATITKNIVNDLTTEGSETIVIQIRSGSTSGTILVTSTSVTVNDTSLTPSYTLSRSAASVDEGSSFTITLTTTGVGNGTTVAYTITGVSSQDLNGANLNDSFTISGGSASKTFSVTADQTTEGTETFTLSLNGRSETISVTINDTSQCPAYGTVLATQCSSDGTYTLITTKADGNCGTFTESDAYNEGTCGYVRVSITSYAVSYDSNGNGKIYDIVLANGTSNKRISIDQNNWFNYPAKNFIDGLTPGQSYILYATDDSNKGAGVSVGAMPTFSISANNSSVNEGDTASWTVTTTRVPNNSTFAYQNFGTTTQSDFEDNSNSGTVTVNNNNGSFSKTLKKDKTTEGNETIRMRLLLNGNVLSESGITNVIDTSKDPTYRIYPSTAYANEGDTVTWYIETTDVDVGTTLYYTNSGTTNANDFVDGNNEGSVTIGGSLENGTASFSKMIKPDSTSEGTETIVFDLRTGGYGGTIVDGGELVTVYDTSQYPAAGTLNYTYCSGTNNWTKYGNYADGSGGTYDAIIEEYDEGTCGYVRVTATYTTDFGAILDITMYNGTGVGREYSVDNGNNWITYDSTPSNNDVYGLPSGQTTVLIIRDSSGKGNAYFVYVP